MIIPKKKVKNLSLSLSFCLLLVNFLFGQSEKQKDSFMFVLKYAEPLEKIETAKQFARKFYKSEPKKVIEVLDEVLKNLSISSLDSTDIYYLKTRSSYYSNNFQGYNINREIAMEILDRYDGPKNSYYFTLKFQQESINAVHLSHSGKPIKALKSYLSAVEYAEKSADAIITYKANLSLGLYYVKQQSHEKAITHLRKCLKVDTKDNQELEGFRSQAYAGLAHIYILTNKLDSLKHYLDLIPKEQYNFSIYSIKLSYFQKREQYVQAITLVDSLINGNLSLKGEPEHWLPYLKMIKADNLYSVKQYEIAEKTWLDSRLEFLKIDDKDNLVYVSKRLYEYYKQRGSFEKALIYHEEHKTINDSMLYQNHNAVLKGLQDSNALNIKEQENKVLKEQELINNLVIQKQRILGLLGLLFIAMLSFLLYIYFRSAKVRRQLNEKLQAANDSLASKNQEIKSRADELSFISENFPDGIARLDHNFKVIYHNKHLQGHLTTDKVLDTNIFQLFEFPIEDQGNFEQDLKNRGEISFAWIPDDINQIFQIQIIRIGELKEYLLVKQDVTELKNKEKKKMLAVEATLQQMKEDVVQNDLEKEALNSSLEVKNKELVTKMMQISKRNAEIEEVLESLKKLYTQSSSSSKIKLSKIISQLNDTLDIEDSWQTFNTYFKEIHPAFLTKLKKTSNALSNNEIRHCTFVKLGLTNKEVADMLNVSVKTVEVARYRIKKKLNLTKEQNLNYFINDIH